MLELPPVLPLIYNSVKMKFSKRKLERVHS